MNLMFGAIGGLMPPVVAGIFPVLVLLTCKAKGVTVEDGLWSFLFHPISALLVLAAFSSVYLIQGFFSIGGFQVA